MHGVKYRSDIDGLRTIAVVPVILFHIGIQAFQGGFVGVDVFFVISGFLITAAIRREIEEGHFTILGFYERRIRRIMPALFAMMLFSLIVAAFLFLPDDFRELGATATSAALFGSNILFWIKTDYFGGAAELKPLIHTWSLAVEEQYYIIFPVFLMLIARFGRRRYILPTAIAAGLSLAVSEVMIHSAPSAAYYLLPSRAWELLAGSLLALGAVPDFRRALHAEVAAGLGLAAILGAVFLLSGSSAFPGHNALAPVLGAALILHAGSSGHTTWVARLLGSRPFVFCGLISYSLYLWHWPFIVFLRYWLMDDFTPWHMAALLVATFIAAWLSWRFVERPFRNRRKISNRAILIGGVIAILAMSVLGAGLYLAKGVPARFASLDLPRIERADQPRPGEPRCFLQAGHDAWAREGCFLTRGTGPTTLLWGDSHGYQYRDALSGLQTLRGDGSILLYASAGCLPVFDISPANRPNCRADNDHVLEVIRAYGVRRVVLAGHWEASMRDNKIGFDAVAATVRRLRESGLEVKLIGDNPDYGFADVDFLAYRLSRRADPAAPYYRAPKFTGEWNARLRDIVARPTSRTRGPSSVPIPNAA